MNDDELDARLRAWGAAARSGAPEVQVPAAGSDRVAHRSWLLPALAGAAVVLAVAGGVTAVQLASGGGHGPGPAAGSGAPDREPAPVHSTGTRPVPPPAGQQQVVFHGLAIDVPASWPLNATRCGTPMRDTVVLPGAVPLCLVLRPPAVTSVEFYENRLKGLTETLSGARTAEVSIDDRPATRLSGIRKQSPHLHIAAVAVPSLSAQVVISSPDQASAEALAATLTIQTVDQNGCSARAAGLGVFPILQGSTRPGVDQKLVPGTPARVTVCRYLGGLIEQSTTLDASQRTALVSLLNGLPSGLSQANPHTYLPSLCRMPATSPGSVTGETASDSEAYLVQASYDSGPDVDVVVRLGLCGNLGASNGTRTGQRTMALAERMASLAGASQGFPGGVRPISGVGPLPSSTATTAPATVPAGTPN